MKAFFAGCVVAVLLAVAAAFVLAGVNKDVDTAFATKSARVSAN